MPQWVENSLLPEKLQSLKTPGQAMVGVDMYANTVLAILVAIDVREKPEENVVTAQLNRWKTNRESHDD